MPTRTASSLRVSRQSTLGTLKVPWNKPKSKGVAVRLFLLFPAFPPMRMYTLCHSLYYTTDFHVSAWRNVRALYIPPPCSADRMLTSTEIQHNSFFLCVLFFKICIHARSTYAKTKIIVKHRALRCCLFSFLNHLKTCLNDKGSWEVLKLSPLTIFTAQNLRILPVCTFICIWLTTNHESRKRVNQLCLRIVFFFRPCR